MEISIYDFLDYREYIKKSIEERSKGKRQGLRRALSQSIGTQQAFISQVLKGDAHFNLEHGEKINLYLGHTEEEAHFFLLMIQRTRAGTQTLKNYFSQQMEQIIERRLILKNRFKVEETLSREDHSIYYSSWHYGAVRVLLTIPEFQTKTKIATRLQLPLTRVGEVLEFLTSRGLARQEGDHYFITELRMHLGNDSSMLAKHHTNWRMQAIRSLDSGDKNDLHYSSAITISEDDAVKIKTMLIDYLEKVRLVVRESPAKELFSFDMDFFKV